MAISIAARAMMIKRCCILAVSAWCTACARYETGEYERLLQQQPMVVVPVDGSHSISKIAGFVVYMKPEMAYKIGAPQSKEFLEMLEDYLVDEGVRYGHPVCAQGYRLVGSYTYRFAVINAECNARKENP